MRIVHFGHSCVLVETGSARLLFDPGTFSSGFEDLRDLDAILVTHRHADHLDGARLPALVEANPTAALVVDQDAVAETDKLGLTAEEVRPGDRLAFGGAEVVVVGGGHANIHQDVDVPTNAGYVVDDGAFYHPGDALFVPEQQIDVLGLPVAAPWLKLGEAIDFLRAVRPRAALPIHGGVLSEVGYQVVARVLTQTAPEGSELLRLTPREPADV